MEATALYVGLVTDNGNLEFSSTTLVARMCWIFDQNGARPAEVDTIMMQNLTMPV